MGVAADVLGLDVVAAAARIGPPAGWLQEAGRVVRLTRPRGSTFYWLRSPDWRSEGQLSTYNISLTLLTNIKTFSSSHLMYPPSTNKLGMTEDPPNSLENDF